MSQYAWVDPTHAITITPEMWLLGEGGWFFNAECACGWTFGRNAYKWVALAAQSHYRQVGQARPPGLLEPEGNPVMGA